MGKHTELLKPIFSPLEREWTQKNGTTPSAGCDGNAESSSLPQSGQPKGKYTKLLHLIFSHLKNNGWKKHGSTFYIERDGNAGLLNFQKSRDSSKHEVIFTVNVAVSSKRLRHYFGYPERQKPEVGCNCHWQKRVGFFMPAQRDSWWRINESTSVSDLFSEVISILDGSAIPEIERNISDKSLMASWKNGACSGITKHQMDEYLVALDAIEMGEFHWKSKGEKSTAATGQNTPQSPNLHQANRTR